MAVSHLLEGQGSEPSSVALAAFIAILCRSLGDSLYSVYLFGSRATGTAKADSDYDLALYIADDERISRIREIASHAAYDFLARGFEIRPVIIRSKDWNAQTQFNRHIRQVGKRLL